MKTFSFRTIGMLVLGVVGAILIGWVIAGVFYEDVRGPIDSALNTIAEPERSALTTQSQPYNGQAVNVARVQMDQPGFLLARVEGTAVDRGPVIGISGYLEAGAHENVQVSLYEEEENRHGVQVGSILYITIVQDVNLDGVYDEGDFAAQVKDSEGHRVEAPIQLTE
jgi:hypothetical protein